MIDIEKQIRYTDEIEEPWTAWFLYGPTGSGKTTAASSFPFPLFLTPKNEKSENALLERGRFPVITLGVDKAGRPLPIMDHTQQVLSWLEDCQAEAIQLHNRSRVARDAGDPKAAKELTEQAYAKFPYETIVFESMTHYCNLVVGDISANGQIQMQQQHWGKLTTHLSTIHDRLRSLQAHIVYTALEQVEEKGKMVTGRPAMVGKMSQQLPAACDVIGFCMEEKNSQGSCYKVHFRNYRVFTARSRFPRVPESVENFNYDQLAQCIGRVTH